MIQIDHCISKSLLGGIAISACGFIFLSCSNIIFATLLSAAVLLSINVFDFNSFVDKCGFISDTSDIRRLVLVLCLNLFTVFLFGLLLSYFVPGISSTADWIVTARLNTPITALIIKSIIAGFLIMLSISLLKSESRNNIILSLLCISGFIYSGCMHCILDTFYYSASSMLYDNFECVALNTVLAILFNFIGGVLCNLLVNKSIIYTSIK